jgi:hypothetical protein
MKTAYRNQFKVAYHGTSKAALASILKEGVIPGAGPGADAWVAETQGRHFPDRHGVFLSTFTTIAATFSQFAAQVRAGIGRDYTLVEGGVVIEIDLSQADPSKIETDESFSVFENDEAKALIYHDKIPANWIRSYCEVHPAHEGHLPGALSTRYVEHNPDLKLGPMIPVKEAA